MASWERRYNEGVMTETIAQSARSTALLVMLLRDDWPPLYLLTLELQIIIRLLLTAPPGALLAPEFRLPALQPSASASPHSVA